MKKLLAAVLLSLFVVTSFAKSRDQIALEARIDELKSQTSRDEQNAESWFRLGVAYHDLASQFGVTSGTEAVSALEKSLELRNDSTTLAYLGSAWTLVARDATNPLLKVNGVLKGVEFLDRAVHSDPTNVIIRRIRYENSFALPDIFERKPVAEKDIDYLIRVLTKNRQAFDPYYDPAHVLYYKARLLAHRNDWREARKYARLAIRIVKDPNLTIIIQNFLDGKNN